jgi:hypothetical protein
MVDLTVESMVVKTVANSAVIHTMLKRWLAFGLMFGSMAAKIKW